MSQAYIYPSSGANTLLTLTPVGSSPNADGATLSGSTFTLQPADSTHPGVVSTAAQSFLGKKTFINGLDAGSSVISHVANPVSAQDAATKAYVDAGIGGLAIAALDSQAPNSNGLALSGDSLSAQSADATHPGMVNTTTQTFAGAKTFTDTLTVDANVNTSAAGNFNTPNQCNAGILAADVWDSQSNGSTITMGGAGRAILISANSLRISSVANPSSAQDAATKAYVDGKIPSPLELVSPYTSNSDGITSFVGVDTDLDQTHKSVYFGSTDTAIDQPTSNANFQAGDITAVGSTASAGGANMQGGSVIHGSGAGGYVSLIGGFSDTGAPGGIVIEGGNNTAGTVFGAIFITGAVQYNQNQPQTIAGGGVIGSMMSFAAIQANSPVSTSAVTPIQAPSGDGQILTVLNFGSNAITLKAGGNVDLPGLVDFLLPPKSTISFISLSNNWYCTGSSIN